MSLLIWIIIFSLVGGVLSVIAASVYLLLPDHHRVRFLPHMVSFATGTLLGAAFLGLLPNAMAGQKEADIHLITFTVLIGILVFFLLEKLVLWRHCHIQDCEIHGNDEEHEHHGHSHSYDPGQRSAGLLVLIGDGVHNFVDGILIAAAFITDIHLGVVTALAVAAHEIPQELGDFAILLQSGFSGKKALFYNMLSTVTTVIGAVLAYNSLESAQNVIPYVLAIAAASFIYIAVADLIPGLHKRTAPMESLQQFVLILCGVGMIYLGHIVLE